MSYRSTHSRGRRAAVLLPIVALSAPSFAADRFWVGPDGASWSDPANWSLTLGGPGGAGVPVAGDNAIVDVAASRTVVYDHDYDVPGIGVTLNVAPTPSSSSQLTIAHGAPASRLTVAGDLRLTRTAAGSHVGTALFNQDAGTVRVGGALRVDGVSGFLPPTYQLNGGTLSVNTASIVGRYIQTGGHLEIADSIGISGLEFGTARFSGGTVHVNLINTSLGRPVFNGAAVTANGLVASTGLGSPTVVTISAGTVAVGTTNFQGTWNQTGGVVSIGNGSFHRGGMTISGGSFSGGTILVTFGLMPGFFRQTGGEANITHLTVQTGTAEFNGGALSIGTLTNGLSIGADGPERVLRLRAYEGGGLHVNDNAVAVDYDGPGSPIATFREHIRAGRITGATDASHGLAYAEPGAVTSVPAVFGAVDATTVLIRVMRYGDADWNDMVNLLDFNRLANNFGQSNKVWTDGDFDYDGIVNLNDFNRLAANFGQSAGGGGVTPQDWANLAAAVPEPSAAVVIIAMSALGVGSTRVRRRRCA